MEFESNWLAYTVLVHTHGLKIKMCFK